MQEPRFRHQEIEYRDHRFSAARAYLWEMRTGKTRMAVESAVALFEAMEIRGVVVIAPNGIHRQWAEEQIHRWGGADNNAFAWRFVNPSNVEDFDLFMLFTGVESQLHWLCVNMEVILRDDVRQVIMRFKKAVGRAMLIVDEAHHMARPGSRRTAVARGLGRKFEYRRILTGTVAEDAPEQTFSQFEILMPAALGHTTYGGVGAKSKNPAPCPTCGPRCRGFKDEFCEFEDAYARGNRFKVISGHKNLDVLKDRMAKYASVVMRSDCEDLPSVMEDHRVAEMTREQMAWWNAVADQDIEWLEGHGVFKVWDGGSALIKLQQIEGGFFQMPGDDEQKRGELINLCGRVNPNPKMLILMDEITQYDGKVIAWFEYTHELEAVYAALTAAKIRCGRFHGKMIQADRDEALRHFKLRDGHMVLLAQPKAAGEGRDLGVARKMIHYSHTPSARLRKQTDARATVMGGAGVQIVDILTPTGKYFRDMTRRKSSVAEDLARSGLKGVIEKIRKLM